MTLNSPNPSYRAKNQAENVPRDLYWRGFRVFSPDFGDSCRLSADFTHICPSGVPCIPPAVEAADAHLDIVRFRTAAIVEEVERNAIEFFRVEAKLDGDRVALERPDVRTPDASLEATGSGSIEGRPVWL